MSLHIISDAVFEFRWHYNQERICPIKYTVKAKYIYWCPGQQTAAYL